MKRRSKSHDSLNYGKSIESRYISCPVCRNPNYRLKKCEQCGYDASLDYSRFLTLEWQSVSGKKIVSNDAYYEELRKMISEQNEKQRKLFEEFDRRLQEIEEENEKQRKFFEEFNQYRQVIELSKDESEDGSKDESEDQSLEQGGENEKRLAEIEPGSSIHFGNYFQSFSKTKKEPIEWIVLDRRGDRLLLTSKYILDCQQYNKEADKTVTWEKCSLRQWLNNEFLNEAFAQEEIDRIENTFLEDENVNDRVFLLSKEQVENYLPVQEERQCNATVFAKISTKLKLYVDDKTKNSFWWLRNTGAHDRGLAMCVSDDGTVRTEGDFVNDNNDGVRPALWLKMTAVEE